MYEYAIRLKRIIDGDTLVVDIDLGFGVWLKDKHVRVSGVDTPEIATLEGKLAREFTSLWMINEPPDKYLIRVENHKSDKYGRILGSVGRITAKKECTYLRDALILSNHGTKYDGGKKHV